MGACRYQNHMALTLSAGLLAGAAAAVEPAPQLDRFLFWRDFPGSAAYNSTLPAWFDPIQTQAGGHFLPAASSAIAAGRLDLEAADLSRVRVDVNWKDHGAIHLYADPSFMQRYDDRVRATNGPASRNWTGI